MPQYEVEALEKFLVRTVYRTEATSKQEAETLCRSGKVAYDKLSVEEGGEEWIKTLSISESVGD